jgi:hypothetical protein
LTHHNALVMLLAGDTINIVASPGGLTNAAPAASAPSIAALASAVINLRK